MKRLLGVALICSVAIAAGLAAGAPAGSRQGQILADMGFKPQPDGFSFENYGESADDLNPQTMQALFGPQVCAAGTGANCTLHPQAQSWMEEQNKSMSGGHCYGFSVAALVFFDRKQGQSSQFGSGSTFGLTRSPKLANYIAYAWVHQTLDSVNSAVVKASPNQIVADLVAALKAKRELYTIAFFKRDGNGGHAVTPFAVERRADGNDAILIYDNNWPNQTREMIVNRAANTWRYNAATNPNEASEQYDGDAQTQSMFLYPTFPGLGVQACPFCGGGNGQANAAGAKPTYDTYFLNGDPRNPARMTIADGGGHRAGWIGNRFVNRIPGARVVKPILRVAVGTRAQQPQVKVPAGRRVTVTIDGRNLKRATTVRFAMVIKGHFVAVRNVHLLPGQIATIRRNASGSTFTYTAGKRQAGKPVFALGFQSAGGKDRSFTIATHGVKGGSTIGFTLDQSQGTLKIDASDDQSALHYDLEMETIDDDGATTQTADDLSLTSDESGTVDYDDWGQGEDEPPIDVDEDPGDDGGGGDED